jgi:hypothetical protein
MMTSCSIHFPANDISSFFMAENLGIDICHMFFIHPLLMVLGWLPGLAIVNRAPVNMGVVASLMQTDCISFRYLLRSRVAGSYGGLSFRFWRTSTASQGGCANLHSLQQCIRPSFSLHPH